MFKEYWSCVVNKQYTDEYEILASNEKVNNKYEQFLKQSIQIEFRQYNINNKG